jgi:hypothetical protein
MEGPLTSTIVCFLLREFFADLGPWYLMSLRTFAIIVTLTMPKGIAGLLAERFDPGLFPLRRRVRLPKERATIQLTLLRLMLRNTLHKWMRDDHPPRRTKFLDLSFVPAQRDFGAAFAQWLVFLRFLGEPTRPPASLGVTLTAPV